MLARLHRFTTRLMRTATAPLPKPTAADLGLGFVQLNHGWNAYPNGSKITTAMDGATLIVRFAPNAYQFEAYQGVAVITLRFDGCARFRVTPVNDHGYALGQCRFTGLAPDWGEFYEITGDTRDALEPTAWQNVGGTGTRHFHFYQRDATLEVKAAAWSKDP